MVVCKWRTAWGRCERLPRTQLACLRRTGAFRTPKKWFCQKYKIKLSRLTMFRSTANTEASNQSVCPYLSPYPQNDQTTSLKRPKTACEASEARGAEPGGTARCSHHLCREHPQGEASGAQPCLSPRGRDSSAERRQQLEDQRRGVFGRTLSFNYTITPGSKTQR